VRAVLEQLDRGLRALERIGVTLAGAGIGVLAVLLLVDMVRRRLLNETFVWLEDLSSLYLLSGAYFLALAYTHRVGAHIYIDVVSSHLGPRAQRVVRFVGELCGILFFSLVLWAGARVLGDEISHDRHLVVTLTWPTWTYYVLVPVGAGLAALRSLLNLFLVPADQEPDQTSGVSAAASI
jgi:TRAP-type C4-dicarboxylate transport system permease small subunit